MPCIKKTNALAVCLDPNNNKYRDTPERLEIIDDKIIQDFPELTCPISMSILDDAVLASDTMTYSRKALLEYSKYSTRSPLTRSKLVTTDQHNVIVFPNRIVNNIVSTLRTVYQNMSLCLLTSEEKIRRIAICREVRIFLMCPLSHEMFSDPVTSSDNITYNRDALRQYVRTCIVSPVTKQNLVCDCNGSVLIFRNLLVKQLASAIEEAEVRFCLTV